MVTSLLGVLQAQYSKNICNNNLDFLPRLFKEKLQLLYRHYTQALPNETTLRIKIPFLRSSQTRKPFFCRLLGFFYGSVSHQNKKKTFFTPKMVF